jgi:uncharacterized membrane protein
MTDMPNTSNGMMTRSWAKYLLIGSLALNVLVFGAVASMALRGPGAWHQEGQSNIFAFMSQLSPERRDELQRQAREMRGTIRELRETVRAASRERAATMLVDPFDRQRYINAHTRQIEADTKLRTVLRDAVADTAAKMTLEERRAFARWRGQRRMMGSSDPGLDDQPAPGPGPRQ